MIAPFLKLALRHLSKNRLYSVINILGLAVGVAACLLIFRLVHYELGFNSHYQNYERIVREKKVRQKERDTRPVSLFRPWMPCKTR